MADLRVCFEAMSFTNVATILQTGNGLFETSMPVADLKNKIQVNLSKTFSYPAKVQIYSLEQLQKIIADYPFSEASTEQHDYVIFLENDLEQALLNEDFTLAPDERVAAGKGVIYWQVTRGSTLTSTFAKLLTRAKYKELNTNRNLKTLRKIAAPQDIDH